MWLSVIWTLTPAWPSIEEGWQSVPPAWLYCRWLGSSNSSCTTAIMSFQGTFWSEILQEVIVIITILGAAIAFVFSLLIMRVLATRYSGLCQCGAVTSHVWCEQEVPGPPSHGPLHQVGVWLRGLRPAGPHTALHVSGRGTGGHCGPPTQLPPPVGAVPGPDQHTADHRSSPRQ